MHPGRLGVESLVELVAYDPAGLRLQVDEAGRPGQGAGGGENPLMGLGPPRTGLRSAGHGIGQIPQRGEIRLVRDGRPSLSELLGPPLRVAADALAGGFAPARTPLFRCHPSQGSDSRQCSHPASELARTLPEERVKMSWVTIDRICQEEADGKEDVRRELVRNGRPLRSSAEPLSDDELLAKLRGFGLDVDRDGVERLCAGALSAEEVAGPIVDKLKLDDMTVDWVWISLLALWQRWWPDRPGLELLDDKMQAGYARDAENDSHAAVVTWLDAWSDVLRLCDATGISSIEEFDDRFPLSQSLFNWSQDLEMALENAGRDNREIRQALIDFCEESFGRFPREDQLLTEHRRRTMAQAYFDAGMTEKAEELFRSWLDADPAWGWGWIGWADCYLPGAGRPADLAP